jgi:drug/metabolite transporter (DMT)-like permease
MALLLLVPHGGVGIVWPAPSAALGLALAGYALVWTVAATASWQYGVTHMEAGRAGVILIAELLVALVSATLIGGETMAPREWLGGALIALGAALEATASPAATSRSIPPSEEPA